MDGRPERGLLAGRLGSALPPAADGPRVRLPGGQRRGAAPLTGVAAALAPPFHRPPEGASGVRARQLRAAGVGQSEDLRPHSPLGGGRDLVRAQPGAVGPARAARPLPVRGYGAGGDVRTHELPGGGGAPVPAHARPAGVPLVPASETLMY